VHLQCLLKNANGHSFAGSFSLRKEGPSGVVPFTKLGAGALAGQVVIF
jgi:hypothetical protein